MRPRTTFVCRECERECKNELYANDRQGAKICDDCAHSNDLREVESAPKVFAYLAKREGHHHLNTDQFFVSNWPGRKIATVIAIWEAKAGHCGKQTYVIAISDDGRLLSGRGPGDGMYCSLRPIKNWPKDLYKIQPFYSRFLAHKEGSHDL